MYLGIDIGGSKVLLAVFDEAMPQVLEEQRFETPPEYKDLVAQISNYVSKLKNKDFKLVVAGVPGRLDRTKGVAIAFGNLPWVNVPIAQDLKNSLKCDILIENDSKLAGLSEAQLVKAKYSKVLYVTIGTGISSALVVNGKLDPETIDSESGQMTLEHKGKMQNWEDIASGKVIKQLFGKQLKDIDDPVQLKTIAHNIALGLIELIPVLNPEVIVMGGGIGAHLSKYLEPLQQELAHLANPMFTIPKILEAKRPEEAVIYGCWELAHQHHEKPNT